MDLNQFGQQNQQQHYYQDQPAKSSNKKFLFIIGGAAILIVVMLFVLLSGGSTAGEDEMRRSLQATSDSVGILDEYTDQLTLADIKNDAALMQIILRGNFLKLNDLYNKTYKPAKKFGNNPKPDSKSQTALSTAARNNTLDSELIKVLAPKIEDSERYLKRAAPNFTKRDSKDSVNKSLEDFESIQAILSKAR